MPPRNLFRPFVEQFVYVGLATVLLIAIVEKWGFYFGFNLKFYEALFLCLCPVALCQLGLKSHRLKLPSPLLAVISLKILYLTLILLSVFPILFAPTDPEALAFFFKGVLQLGTRTFLMILLVLLLVSFSEARRRKLILVHVFAVTLSAFYGLAQAAALFFQNVDLDQTISRVLAPFTGSEGPDLARYAYGSFYRLNGLAGDPNLHAAYAITAVPIMMAFFLARPRWYLGFLLGIHACMIGLTMSISGMIGMIVSLGVLLFFRVRLLKPVHFVYISLLLALAAYEFASYQTEIMNLVAVRTDLSGTATTHSDIATESLGIYAQYPMGVGYNNFSLAWRNLSSMYADRAMNPHNTYIAILVESGPLALACELLTYAFMMVVALRQGGPLAKVFVACLAGICVAALGYETLEMFYAQTFIFLCFTCVILGDRLGAEPKPPGQNGAPESFQREASQRETPN